MEKREKKGELGLPHLHMLDFPLHILCDIILKLPPRSVIRCASVCTTFRDIVNDPSFRQLYFSRSPTSCVVLTDHHRLTSIDCCAQEKLARSPPSSCIACFSSSSSSASTSSLSGIDPNLNLNQPNLGRQKGSRFIQLQVHMKLVNSSHGLVCLRSHYLYYVCNPLFGEILALPPPPTVDYLRFAAFGFDPVSKQYKLVQIVPRGDQLVAELYQLGQDTWRVIENASSARLNSAFDPSLNGALHWITHSTRVEELISSFDIHTEKFKWVAPPSQFNSEYLNHVFGLSVGVLKDRLCLCYVNRGACFETWFMDEYGVQASWTRAFSIDIHSYCGLRLGDKHRPIGFTSSGDMWLKVESDSDTNSHSLVSYSAQKRLFRHIEIGGISFPPRDLQAAPHVFTFVSLKDFVHPSNQRLRLQILTPNKHYSYHNHMPSDPVIPMHQYL
ncbi:hypothetical protein VNO77_06075 [Canavalia gladiata]|uniref:F-box domain-containing protein n=1 Tax=Canavalia gladiata TaxID=3824 RepID=A0AAN9N4M7_CANGL